MLEDAFFSCEKRLNISYKINGLSLFFLRVKLLLYILEALRHNNMPGLLPGWTRKDIEQLPNFFFTATGRNAKLVIYPRSAQA